MTPENFTYWLNGLFELTGTEELSKEQVAMIKEHLALVFTKVTTPLNIPQEVLDMRATFGEKPYFEHRPYYNMDKYCTTSGNINEKEIC